MAVLKARGRGRHRNRCLPDRFAFRVDFDHLVIEVFRDQDMVIRKDLEPSKEAGADAKTLDLLAHGV